MASHSMFTAETQYSKANIEAFEATFGAGFMSAGGLESTVEMARILEPILKRGSSVRILDVGCGIGGAVFYFASTYGCKCDGKDVNSIGIEMAKKSAAQQKLDHLVTFQVMDVLNATVESNSYDIIYSRDALLHIPHEHKPAMYKSFHDWLKPNGVLCVGDYCIGQRSAAKMNPDFQKYLDQRGYHLHSAQGWNDVLQEAGFEADMIESQDRALWYCQTCQREVDNVGIPGSDGNTEFLKQFSQEKLDGLIGSYRDKITMTLRGDRSYVIVTAYKTKTHAKLRQEVCDAYKTMSKNSWIMSCDGNASARVDETTCMVTPSGVMVPDLDASKVVWVNIKSGKGLPDEDYKPTSEVALHTLIYQRRPDVGAIVHSHSIYACALSCSRIPLPPSHYAVCELLRDFDFSSPTGGSTAKPPITAEDAMVKCAPYYTYGTRKLAQVTAEALGKNHAVFMASHGAIVTGSNMEEALYNCERLERECEIYWRSVQLSSVGAPQSLTIQEIKNLQTADGSYGQEHFDVSADDALDAAGDQES